MVENTSIEHLANEISGLALVLMDLISVREKRLEGLQEQMEAHVRSMTPHRCGPLTMRRYELVDEIPDLKATLTRIHDQIVAPGKPSVLARLTALETHMTETLPRVLTALETILDEAEERFGVKCPEGGSDGA
jgi:hypothetical protein